MYSNGQKLLFEHGIKQATCFHASLIEKEVRIAWTDSFSKFKHRGIASKISDSTIFLVLSQNCDIAAYNDGLESAIELLVREFNFEVRHSPMPPDGTLRIP